MPSEMCCGLYRGTFYLKDLSDEDAALLPVGNAEANITQEMTEITQPNYQSLGGSACKVTYPESVNLDLILHCNSPENLAIAFLGQASQLVGAAVEDELHPVNSIGELIPFLHAPDKSIPVVIESADGLTTYDEGDDYVVTNAGIIIATGSSIPVAGANIRASYTYGANWRLDAQTISQKEFLVVLDGVNVGEGEEIPVVLKAWKVKFSPAETFALISGEDFASLEISGEILRDDTVLTGSKFFTVEWGV